MKTTSSINETVTLLREAEREREKARWITWTWTGGCWCWYSWWWWWWWWLLAGWRWWLLGFGITTREQPAIRSWCWWWWWQEDTTNKEWNDRANRPRSRMRRRRWWRRRRRAGRAEAHSRESGQGGDNAPSQIVSLLICVRLIIIQCPQSYH